MKCLRPTGVGSLVVMLLLSLSPAYGQSSDPLPEWPAETRESKPWTRWWWMGSSVNREDLTAAMETYREAGLGGLEITPIYGVKGYEDRFIDYLSADWMAMLAYTLEEAERLGLGVDMATGTGWPFGGPWVRSEEASKNVAHRIYELEGGERLSAPVGYTQEPLVRAVGRRMDVSQLVEPVAENENLQALALEQVRFEKPLPLQALVAYSDTGEILDLTDRVDAGGQLDWVAPAGHWTLYAVFQGWHGKLVERAAPGGEGAVIDHFSEAALRNYLQRFDAAFAGHDVRTVRAFFNDSYEVDDASGQADWTPDLFAAFENWRGYDLREHLPALFGRDAEERNARVRSDYRETISDLLLEKFTVAWQDWAERKGAVVRNQAHGSPANILDLYAASDIPEAEGTEILRIKFASSAANVSGKQLASSESATWLNEHFTSSLADVKEALDRFFLSGINHIFYHGTNFSPREETWPGWLFYAAVHFTPANPFWRDFPALNRYVTRTQSFLQAGKPDPDVLLYFPVHDAFAAPGNEMLAHFDGIGPVFDGSAFKAGAETLQDRGYAFDFISDRQLRRVDVADRLLHTGGIAYQTVVLPACRFMPLETLEQLVGLVQEGATVVVYRGLPGDVAGLHHLEARREAFQQLVEQIRFSETEVDGIREAGLGEGAFLLGDDLEQLLSYARVRRESMVEDGLQFVRRSHANGHRYFLVNRGEDPVDGWVPLQVEARSAALFDPMQERRGFARVRSSEAGTLEVYVQLAPGESCIVETYASVVEGAPFHYVESVGAPTAVDGTWSVRFVEGGPVLPSDVETDRLGSWTEFEGDAVKAFSGTATYTISFPAPEGAGDGWLLDLGRVHESAGVRLNGEALGTLIGPNYQIPVDRSLFRENNVLEVHVTNLMANRIADLDRRQVNWKKFYNINFPAWRSENRGEGGLFDASKWLPGDSGLLGPVTLTPIDFVSSE